MFEAKESHEQTGLFEKVTVTRLQGTDWRGGQSGYKETLGNDCRLPAGRP